MMAIFEARDESNRPLMHVKPPMKAVRRQPNLFTNTLVKAPRENVKAKLTEPTQAVKDITKELENVYYSHV